MQQVVHLKDVTVRRGNAEILQQISWKINAGEQWVVLGPNGAGKTTLVSLLATLIFPSSGSVEILDEELGLVDVFELRTRIGLSSSALIMNIDDRQSVFETVKTAAYGMTASWKEQYEATDEARVNRLLIDWGLEDFAQRSIGTLSEGERKRVQIARALMPNPELLILDEPAAGLDMSAREKLTATLTEFISRPDSPNTILITHHVEEIPPTATHAMMLRQGNVIAAGPIAETLNSANLSATFDLGLTVGIFDTAVGRRWSARLT